MALSATPMIVPKKTQDAIIAFSRECTGLMARQWNLREQFRKIDLDYMREKDLTKAHKRAQAYNRYGDADKLQNVTIPVVMPQVEAAVTYQTSVFLTGTPLFGVVSSPVYEDEAMQMEAVIDENSIRGGWARELQLFFRDGFKYNLGAIEVVWDRKVTSNFDTEVSFGNGTQGKPKEVIWTGNCLNRIDPYNLEFDTRVPPTEVHKRGEFVGYTKRMSRIELKKFMAELPDKMVDNVKMAFESGLGSAQTSTTDNIAGTYYTPVLNPAAITDSGSQVGTNWLAWAEIAGSNTNIQYKDSYEVKILYCRILPSDFGLKVPSQNTPQIWKFIIVNHQILIYAERQTNAHDMLPILLCQPNEDGLSYQTKSRATNVAPIQDVATALMNSVLAARRRAISDRGIYDPSRIAEHHINSPNPSAKIPVRPAAYGKNLSEAYYAIPFNDSESPMLMQQIGMLNGIANTITGNNPVKQGQFVKGNKTQHEFDSVMANANGRDQMCSLLLEAQIFTPMKEILKSNILQYQIAGDVYSRSTEQQVQIDPVALRKAILQFKLSDGLTPTDKLINSDTLSVALQQIGTSPQIGSSYNIGPLFSYLMKTQGADLKEFEKSPAQVAYEQAVSQWQQLVMQLVKTNPDIKQEQYPPMPSPQQYGYNPQAQLSSQQPAPASQSQQPQGQ